ncbi:hypothetical protein [Arcticibacter tournemirensis]|uniref:DUF4157 domain-containing protein n=1 Tax=Arcticibacter tournemirensis TaxID=699437 RepID=A0A4Q0M5N3_9SPHI|nr:hypothetical protein [Arcticibacter tournemirensis]RXF68049.1 hypothetical protein EKH83_17420 [Arcticibacter tournemirensis]
MADFGIIHVSFLPAEGMAIFPFILVKKKIYKTDALLIRHEHIHLRQQVEMIVIFFYLFYLLNYLFNLLYYRNHRQAYLNIIFEKEAYTMEGEVEYLKKRRPFAWIKFIF